MWRSKNCVKTRYCTESWPDSWLLAGHQDRRSETVTLPEFIICDKSLGLSKRRMFELLLVDKIWKMFLKWAAETGTKVVSNNKHWNIKTEKIMLQFSQYLEQVTITFKTKKQKEMFKMFHQNFTHHKSCNYFFDLKKVRLKLKYLFRIFKKIILN